MRARPEVLGIPQVREDRVQYGIEDDDEDEDDNEGRPVPNGAKLSDASDHNPNLNRNPFSTSRLRLRLGLRLRWQKPLNLAPFRPVPTRLSVRPACNLTAAVKVSGDQWGANQPAAAAPPHRSEWVETREREYSGFRLGCWALSVGCSLTKSGGRSLISVFSSAPSLSSTPSAPSTERSRPSRPPHKPRRTRSS